MLWWITTIAVAFVAYTAGRMVGDVEGYDRAVIEHEDFKPRPRNWQFPDRAEDG